MNRWQMTMAFFQTNQAQMVTELKRLRTTQYRGTFDTAEEDYDERCLNT